MAPRCEVQWAKKPQKRKKGKKKKKKKTEKPTINSS